MSENWGIVGHDWAVQMLREQMLHGSVRHAYLIAGPPGVGRRTLALRFAKALNCTQPVEPGTPCGKCWDCRQFEAQEHPDLVVLQARPKDQKPAVDRLGNRRAGLTLEAEPVRESRLLLALKPYRARYRVAIYLHFEEASPEAANALLKTLEETPPSSIMILIADSVEALLPTIASRCEVLRLQPSPAEIVEKFLTENGADQNSAHLIAHVSGGRPGLALRLLQDSSSLAYRQQKLDDLRTLLQGSRAQRFAYADVLAGDKTVMRGVLMLWLSFWRDVMWRASGASAPIANIDRETEIDSVARRIGLLQARRVVSDLDKALERLEANVNARLLAEVLLLDWPR